MATIPDWILAFNCDYHLWQLTLPVLEERGFFNQRFDVALPGRNQEE
ncbi:MAG: hypothetical protein F6K65_28180 [Moorea sp. SIO3C2]|nr:hypothetical protein [Moorena sp. SIO3C2]